MPIYEYLCNACNGTFEYLQGPGEKDVRVFCPKCESGDVTKLFSAFSMGRRASGGSGSSPFS